MKHLSDILGDTKLFYKHTPAVYFDTDNHLTKEKLEKIVRKLRDENEDHPNNMILGYFNFIHHVKGKVNGLNKLAAKILQPFLAETDMVDPFREHRIYVN